MKEVELIVFDMAGTVVNEDNVVYKTVQKAINKVGYSVSLEYVLKEGAGKEKHQAIKDILNKIKKEEGIDLGVSSNEIFKNFEVMLDMAYKQLDVKPYEGLEMLMAELKQRGIKIALNTGYNKKMADFLLDKMNWKKGIQYDLLVTADDVQNGRPAPDMILKAMERLNISKPENVIKIGDSAIDIEEGKDAGCGYTIAVTTGAQNYDQLSLANPDHILNDLTKLIDIIW